MARRTARPKEDDPMPPGGGGIDGEYSRPDAKRALKIYDTEIAPKNAKISTIKGDLSEPHKRIKDDCHVPRSTLNFVTKLDDMEDAKRDHHLLALRDLLAVRNYRVPTDLVTMAQGGSDEPIIPTGERARPKLVTIPHPEDDSDLAGEVSETSTKAAGVDEDGAE